MSPQKVRQKTRARRGGGHPEPAARSQRTPASRPPAFYIGGSGAKAIAIAMAPGTGLLLCAAERNREREQ